MLRKRVLILVIIISLVGTIILGCAKEKKEPEKELNANKNANELTVKDVYPLNQGDYWKFKGEGNEFAAFEQKVLFREGDRVQLQVASGGTVMGMIYEFEDGKLAVVLAEEEFYEEENILHKDNEMSQVILQEPIKPGNTWVSGNRTYKIEAIDTVVETPAGKFSDCITISNTGEEDNVKSLVYYKPGLGLIKQEYLGEEFEIIAELEEYEVASYK